MGSFSVAAKLADELGTSVTKARRFVDNAGDDTATSLLEDVQRSGSRTLPDGWWKPVAAGGGIAGVGTGGALAWRQQDVWKAQEATQQSENYNDAIKRIIDSDLPENVKLQLAKGAEEAAKNGGGGGGDDDGLLPDDVGQTIILVIVLVLVVSFALNQAGEQI